MYGGIFMFWNEFGCFGLLSYSLTVHRFYIGGARICIQLRNTVYFHRFISIPLVATVDFITWSNSNGNCAVGPRRYTIKSTVQYRFAIIYETLSTIWFSGAKLFYESLCPHSLQKCFCSVFMVNFVVDVILILQTLIIYFLSVSLFPSLSIASLL